MMIMISVTTAVDPFMTPTKIDVFIHLVRIVGSGASSLREQAVPATDTLVKNNIKDNVSVA